MVDKLFQVHKLNGQGLALAVELAEAFDVLLSTLKGICPEGREFAIVKTKLEEASFFAKKSIANEEANQCA